MQKLSEHLASTDKTAAQLARELDVETSTITRILKGERRPSRDLALRISELTGVPVIDLLYS